MRPGRPAIGVAGVVLFLLLSAAVGAIALGIAPPARAIGPGNGISPAPASYAAMAYDPGSDSLVLFGGKDVSGTTVATTWEFHAGNWTNLTAELSVVPAARWGASMAYDAADGEIVLFGGCSTASCEPAMNDTWAFHGGHWTDLTSTAGPAPPARGMASLAAAGSPGGLVLFGGTAGGNGAAPYNDTWTFANGTWQPWAVPPGAFVPPGRYDAAFAYDSATNSSILFGGIGASSVLGDTWAFADGTWSQLSAGGTGAPSARHAAAMCYDSGDGYLLLVGGYAYGTIFSDQWTYRSGEWSSLSPGGAHVGGIYAAAMAYDAFDGYVVLFSGAATTDSLYTATAGYTGGSWTILDNPAGSGSTLWVSLLLVLLVPGILILVQIATLAGQAVARRRERRDFDTPPGALVTWLPAPRWYRTPGSLAGAVIVFVFLFVLELPFAAVSGNGAFALAVFLLFGIPLLVVWLVLFLFTVRAHSLRSVGLAEEGVIFQRRSSELRVRWSNLQPSPMVIVQRRGWFVFHYARVDRPERQGAIAVPYSIAKAIIESPYAPRWILSPVVVQTLGLPASRGLMPAEPAPAPPPPPGPSNAPLPSSPRPIAASPHYPPPPPPPPAPARYVARPPPPPPPPANEIVCPSCRARLPRFAYVFCPTCGNRLPT